MEDIKCQVCATQEIFENMVAIGLEQDEAFHMAVTLLLENVIETAIDEGYEAGHLIGIQEGLEDGYAEGYAEACGDLSQIVSAYADSLED